MKKTVFILGMSSDIGWGLAEYYSNDGYVVIGTYRQEESIRGRPENKNIYFLKCNILDKNNIKRAVQEYAIEFSPWSIFISCIGTMEPIGNFFSCDFDSWEQSVISNSTAQLRFFHEIYPYRYKEDDLSHVIFTVGGSVNGIMKNYSAYCASKIFLLKMCELLNDENDDLNIFSVGPGWVRTKLHNETLKNQKNADQHYKKTIDFLEKPTAGTPIKDIYGCMNWCVKQGKSVVGGRNFSVVYDQWRNEGEVLIRNLLGDQNKFKLRRFKNEE